MQSTVGHHVDNYIYYIRFQGHSSDKCAHCFQNEQSLQMLPYSRMSITYNCDHLGNEPKERCFNKIERGNFQYKHFGRYII